MQFEIGNVVPIRHLTVTYFTPPGPAILLVRRICQIRYQAMLFLSRLFKLAVNFFAAAKLDEQGFFLIG